MLDAFMKYVLGEFHTIAEAPASFVVVIVGCLFLAWVAMDWRYGVLINHKDSEIALAKSQRDDYRDKLGGASPDQAKERIDALERRLAQIEPRRLDQEQRTKLSSRLLSLVPSTPVKVSADGMCSDCNQYAAHFIASLSGAGWQTLTPVAMGIGGPKSPKGVTLRIYDLGNSSPEGILLAQAFEAAAIPFDVVHQPKPPNVPGLPSTNASVLITARVVGAAQK